MIFAYFLGMCSFIAVSKNVKTAFGLGVAVTFMLVVTLPVNYLLQTYVLSAGALSWLGPEYADVDLSFLSLIMFIAVIASMTQLVEMTVEKYSPALYSSLGIFLPLIAVNCAILGGSLFMQQRDFPSVWTAVCAGGGWGLGWLLAITAIAAIRERLATYSNIPKPLRGVGITFILTALNYSLKLSELENLNIFIRSIFIDNMIFAYFLGMCSFIAVSKNVKTAFGLGVAVTFMLVVTLPVNYLLQTYVLSAGALSWLGPEYADVDLSFLSLIMFIAVIASMTQLVEMTVEKYSPALYSSLGIFLPLIAVNCAILGGSLFMQQRDFPSVWTAVCAGGGWGLGWLLAITAIAAIRERLATYSNIPKPLRGVGITFILTALMGIAFMSFLGIKI